MLILCSHEAMVLNRWQDALSVSQFNIVEINTIKSLRAQLSRSNGLEVVLLHENLPQLDGIKGIVKLHEDFPNARIMVFSNHPDNTNAMQLLPIGVYAYANTYMHPKILVKAVEIVSLGEVWVGKELMLNFINETKPVPDSAQNNPSGFPFNKLTEREKEIAMLVAQGESNKQIARLLDITERTVKAHMTSILATTGANDRLKLAIQLNLLLQASPDRQVS